MNSSKSGSIENYQRNSTSNQENSLISNKLIESIQKDMIMPKAFQQTIKLLEESFTIAKQKFDEDKKPLKRMLDPYEKQKLNQHQISTEELKNYSLILYKLYSAISNIEKSNRKKLNLIFGSFNVIFFRNERVKEQLELLGNKTNQVNRDALAKKRERLIKEIKSESEIIELMMKYESEKRKSSAKTDTLEEYLDKKLLGLQNDINEEKTKLLTTNEEIRETNAMILEKTKNVAKLRHDLNDVNNVSKSKMYQSILSKNVELKKDFDKCSYQKEELHSCNQQLKKMTEETKEKIAKQQIIEARTHQIMNALHFLLECFCNSRNDDALKSHLSAVEESLKTLWRTTRSMTEKHSFDTNEIINVNKESSDVESENRMMIKLIIKLNQELQLKAQNRIQSRIVTK